MTEEKSYILDREDPLAAYREQFYLPKDKEGNPLVYFCGNSLGLQPKTVKSYVNQELEDWKNLGVEGHFHAKNPWMPYHEFLTESMASLVGGQSHEVVVMNTLSVNLHLMMVSFYRPTEKRYKILIESDAFPSDLYAVESQIRHHGFDPEEALIIASPAEGKEILEEERIEALIDENRDTLALLMIGGVNYYTGQFFDIERLTKAAHAVNAIAGFDLAHAAGNVPLALHEWDVDFACWCTYKYLNSGPGGISGCFVHERHGLDPEVPRFAGWWGHEKSTRFNMRKSFKPIPGAEGWQLSNPPILPMASLRASLDIFSEVGMEALRAKSLRMKEFMLECLDSIPEEKLRVITPRDPERSGCQFSLQLPGNGRKLFDALAEAGVIADWREPDVVRIAPVPLYNSFNDIYLFVQRLKRLLNEDQS